MATESVDVLIEGGKATAAPPLGPALGPLGVNIGQVVAEINKKTESFKGMQVPVKVEVNSETKTFEIKVGTPPASALIKKEAGIPKGAGNPKTDQVADLKIEQVIKIAKMKADDTLGKNNFSKVKEIIGTCQSMGVMIEGKAAHDTIDDINNGMFKDKIESGKTELSAEEQKEVEEEQKALQEELKTKYAEFEATAKGIIAGLTGKSRDQMKAALIEAKIPSQIMESVLPAETPTEPKK